MGLDGVELLMALIVVQEQLGIPDAKYREDAHFINDFGMD
jgi:hypothetical protein